MPLGGLISIAALIPNIVWAFSPSSDLQEPRNEWNANPSSRALAVLEQVARFAVFGVPFFYTFAPLHPIERTALVVSLAALCIYYLCWFRYFARGRSIRLLYQPLWGMPVPMAVSPVIYFAAASVVLHAIWLAAATVALSLLHIPSSYRDARRLLSTALPSSGQL